MTRITGLKQITRQITASGTGASAELDLPFGQHILFFRAASWGSAQLQILEGGTAYPYLDNGSAVTVTANRMLIVPGGQKYRLNVTAAPSTITVTAKATTRGSVI